MYSWGAGYRPSPVLSIMSAAIVGNTVPVLEIFVFFNLATISNSSEKSTLFASLPAFTGNYHCVSPSRAIEKTDAFLQLDNQVRKGFSPSFLKLPCIGNERSYLERKTSDR